VSTWNLLLTLHAPDTAGVGERRAAAALLGAWLWDDLPVDHTAGLIEELDVDGAPVSLRVLDWTTGTQNPQPRGPDLPPAPRAADPPQPGHHRLARHRHRRPGRPKPAVS
jgi:hypothetical protein